jgi:FMN hydrolase / 5-amino-6-(5-phospho-D-ribitylamino)uracil phosphatase
MNPDAVRAICFDLDDTLWAVEPVLARAERILADWLARRYPGIAPAFAPATVQRTRALLLAERPDQAHDLTFLRRETLKRVAAAAGLPAPDAESLAREAFELWHGARNEVTPFAEVVPALDRLRRRFRLATLSNGNADLVRIGLAHHFECTLHAAGLGCAKPDPRSYARLAEELTLQPVEILFVGDEPHADVVGPRAAGMQTVWVNRSAVVWPDGLPAADACISDLTELEALLAGKV